MKKVFFGLALVLVAGVAGAENERSGSTNQLMQPLSLVDCLNFALQQNPAIMDARADLEASHGLVVQTRAVALPRVTASGQYRRTQPGSIENFPSNSVPNQSWNAGVQIVQDIYNGGRTIAAFQAAGATKKQALAQFNASTADALLAVRIAYYDVLLANQQITVHEASVNLLQKELEDQQSRYNAGTVPKFNVLRAEVAVANERPALIQARSSYRISKNNLANLLGINLPRDIWEDVPLKLSDELDNAPYQVNLPDAIQQALSRRSELMASRENETLQKLAIVNARAGYKPTVSVFAGYDWKSSQFVDPTDLGYTFHGWNAGGLLSWNIFDGLLTHGKVVQAKAQHQKAKTDLANQSRQIELEVRTAYSSFVEAKETLESQEKVQEEADEALREANARATAGTGTQLDVLDAETALTQARTTQIQALHDYDAARARLQRAIGEDMAQPPTKGS
ncbi:MAG TPA: TolC family protein [Desulfuromonadaceae bacterium]|nr:TolC family protein [Desulfuromonadaceae bacterium]